MKPIVSPTTLNTFSDKLTARSAARHRKKEKEVKYETKVNKINEENFNKLVDEARKGSVFAVIHAYDNERNPDGSLKPIFE